ncbi:hypothetical protein [Microbacterium album]|uniref:Uncharacterized protein n=1 Tax=Microbacterium album TaxID=2053191 RepID=A0A917IB06_9MICO|nr:hypothetical protein [Microbacterium album]GGH33988.1 hypothetical protein GCM10010921_01350 [Microbacterium album]
MSELPPARITDPASAVAWSHYVREKVTPTPDPSHIVAPDDVIAELQNLKAAAGRMVLVVKEADDLRGTAARALARATAKAQMQVREEAKAEKLTVDEKAARVEQLTATEADEAAVAERAYQYARSVARLVDDQKSAVQTIARLVELTFSLAGSRRAG